MKASSNVSSILIVFDRLNSIWISIGTSFFKLFMNTSFTYGM